MQSATTRSEELRRFLAEQLGDGFEAIEADTPILEMGILDSLMVQNLLAFIENRFRVMMPPERVRPESFRSVAEIARTVESCDGGEYSMADQNPLEITNRLMESYGLERGWLELESGRQHLLRCQGESPTLVLLPGLGSPASAWGTLMRSLSGRRSALALDLAGFGVSDPPADGDCSFPAHVRRTISILEREVAGPCVLIGSSAGAMIAAEIARLRPELCHALVVISFGRVADPRHWWDTLRRLSGDPDEFWRRAFFAPPPLSDALRDQLSRTITSPAYLEFLDDGSLGRLDGLFEGLELPTLFLGGMEDGIVDRTLVEAGVEQVRGAQLQWIAHCGHYAQSERPEEVLVCISHFLEQIGV